MVQLEFDIWGSIPFGRELTCDGTVQEILLATQSEPRSIPEIADTLGVDRGVVKERINELARWELIVRDECNAGKWVANMPIYTAAALTASEGIGLKYAGIEVEILRSSLPGLRESYESCEISSRFPWESVSLIIVGGLVADLCVYDRVRFFPQYLEEGLVPPLHADGSRWGYVGYERRRPRFRQKRWAFCQNLDLDEPRTGGLATFSYFDPPPQRQRAPKCFFGLRVRPLVFGLGSAQMSFDEMASMSPCDADELRETLEEWTSSDPPAVRTQNGRYSLRIPILSRSDLGKLVGAGDAVAETIHVEVTVPSQKERSDAGKEMGLRFPLAEGFLARDIALRLLVEEGRLSEVAEPPVPWNFGVWGWRGSLPLWEEATREMQRT